MTKDLAVPASAAALISFDDLAREDPALAGNKAATLPVLRRAGFEVPPGVVLPADALVGVDSPLRDLDRTVPGLTRSADVGLRM